LKVRSISSEVCRQRWPLVDKYKQYFGDVYHMTRDNCRDLGDPYSCVARVMQKEGAGYDGIFYMHFDALFSPRHLAKSFNKDALGIFDEPKTCKVNTTMDLEDCAWASWQAKGPSYLVAMEAMREVKTLPHLPPSQVILGNDDLFYIPRRLYTDFITLAKWFLKYEVHHELAGPAIRRMLEGVGPSPRPAVNFNCTGNCCDKLMPEDALKPKFRCGHPFDLASEVMRTTFARVVDDL